MCLAKGRGVRLDLVRAAEYHRLAADQKCAAAQNNYASSLETGLTDTANPKLALRYYEFAAQLGDATGLHHRGRCLEFGIGSETDSDGAVECYRLAAEKGNPHGEVDHGFCLEHGIGVEQDVEKSLTYIQGSSCIITARRSERIAMLPSTVP
jgi:TPR repeat protein